MRFSVSAVLAFAATALAAAGDPTAGFNAITKPTEGEQVPAGSTYEIVWSPSAANPGPVTIGLLGGADPGHLSVVATIAKAVDASKGAYSWSVPSDATLATYGIIITLESNTTIFQYGFPFKITGGTAGSSTTTSASGSASASSTASGSATGKASSSTVVSSTSAASSSAAPSSTVVSSSSIRSNSTTTAGGQTTITTFVSTSTPSATKSATSSIVTNGVASLAAGSFAMIGGVAMAVLAL
jgi:hypothetical protein